MFLTHHSVLTALLVSGSQQKSPEPERALIVSEEGKTTAGLSRNRDDSGLTAS